MSVIAIVGRPNVGKSTLFNRLLGRRKALVSDIPGVTRDRHYAQAEWCGCEFVLVDTGGLSFDKSDAVESLVHKQSMAALDEADVVICLLDGRDGLTSLDLDIVEMFRKSVKSVVYAVNKVDTEDSENLLIDFSSIGIDLMAISAEHGRNIDELLDKVIKSLPVKKVLGDKAGGIRIAIVGRPNVGKSTIINSLCQEDRVVAHEVAGTTRDSIDVDVDFDGVRYTFVDTAGIKKRSKTSKKIDKFSIIKSLRAIDDADIVFVVLNAEDGLTHQDMGLIAHAYNSFKATAILLNKWDLVEAKTRRREYTSHLQKNLKELQGLPLLCMSGKTGYGCRGLFKIAAELNKAKQRRLTTSELNRFLREVVGRHPPPDWKSKQVKLNYIAQVESDPPVFTVFTNRPGGLSKTYKRFLTNGLKKLLGEPVVPIVLKFRSKR